VKAEISRPQAPTKTPVERRGAAELPSGQPGQVEQEDASPSACDGAERSIPISGSTYGVAVVAAR